MQYEENTSVEDAVQVLAMVGDLSMGLPTDHSQRTARLAARLAENQRVSFERSPSPKGEKASNIRAI